MFGLYPKTGYFLSQEEWILKYGSKRLRTLRSRNLMFEHVYLKERANKEFASFHPFKEEILGVVPAPNRSAIRLIHKIEQRGHAPQVVWCQCDLFSVIYGERFTKVCEVVLIPDYHGIPIYNLAND